MRYLAATLFVLVGTAQAADRPMIFNHPAISRQANCVWLCGGPLGRRPRGGRRGALTSGVGLETHPVFSPDGTQVAFGGEYDGNLDVYVVPIIGGEPKRLTYHPDPDLPVAWTPDGKSILFRSTRSSYGRFTQLFTITAAGGPETDVDLPMAEEGSYSLDAAKLAYVPFTNTRPFPGRYMAWKRYRGGSASFIWIADLKSLDIEKVPHGLQRFQSHVGQFHGLFLVGSRRSHDLVCV